MAAAAFGLGAALVFNPSLVQYGMAPTVSSDTGMYLSMMGSLSSTIVVVILGKLNPYYALTISVMTAFGTLPGLYGQLWLVAKTGRPSITLALLFTFILFCAFANPILSIINMSRMVADGEDVLQLGTYC
jgi:uncharacterized membrane protein YfcA